MKVDVKPALEGLLERLRSAASAGVTLSRRLGSAASALLLRLRAVRPMKAPSGKKLSARRVPRKARRGEIVIESFIKALGFSTRMLLYSVSTIGAGTDAMTEVTVTAELRGRRFHGRSRSTDVIEASLRAYMKACNAIGESGILEGPSDFHVAGEYLWE